MVASVRVISGVNDAEFVLPDKTPISAIRASLVDAFNITDEAVAFVNGKATEPTYRLRGSDTVEFVVRAGRKGMGSPDDAKKRNLYREEVKKAAEEIQRACEQPEALVIDLARLVSRKPRTGVISDQWSFRNQLLIHRRGYSQARGADQWAKVGREVSGSPLFIVMPMFGTVEEVPKTKTGKPRKNAKPVKEKKLFGYMGVPVYGLEQTTPMKNYITEEKYTLFPDPDKPEFIQIVDGLKVPWWQWYSDLRSIGDQLTGQLGATIVAKCLDDQTEVDDLIRKLREQPAQEIAKRISPACMAVQRYLTGKAAK